ncbi:MAG: 3-phosphoshikimate 1-carboxyvinyltransferase [Lachnospiraceae bacterium]|nr:3-phosphoshikimate 1-carboxyvinyltransferase [Lachnospiraceae bacterium]
MAKQYAVRCIYDSIANDKKEVTLSERVPGSKSITNRALLLATLAKGDTTLEGVLLSDDSRHFLECVKDLGVDIDINGRAHRVNIKGCNGKIPKKKASVYVGSAGTAARFLAATLGVSKGEYEMDASAQMRKRPMAPLLKSLSDLGCKVKYPEDGNEGHFPFTLEASGFGSDSITINIDKSSQFLSALLIAAVLSPNDFTVNVEGSHGMAYIDMTIRMMEQFGVIAEKAGSGKFVVRAGQKYTGKKYVVEPDASAAAYFYAMSPLLGLTVQVPTLHFDSLQGDVNFIKILEKTGCKAVDAEGGIILYPPKNGKIKGIEVDMSACSDQAITLAAIAPFAESPVTITGIGHIRLQESDRLSAIATELKKMKIKVEEGKDYIKIYPGMPQPSVVDTYEDHRMAMGFSLIGLRAEGIVIDNPNCCKKTFERYFDKLDGVITKLVQE